MKIFIVSPVNSVKDQKEKNFLLKKLLAVFYALIKANLVKHEKNNIDFSNIKIIGVDGSNYDPALNEFLSDNWKNSYLRNMDGTKGCALSHIKILKYIE